LLFSLSSETFIILHGKLSLATVIQISYISSWPFQYGRSASNNEHDLL